MKKNLQKALLLGIVISLIGMAAYNEFDHMKDVAIINERVKNGTMEDYEIRIIDSLTDERYISYDCYLDDTYVGSGIIER